MASNYMFSDTSPPESQRPSYRPLTSSEREQLRAHENVDLILAWALVKKIVLHPEFLEQIRIKSLEVKKKFLLYSFLKSNKKTPDYTNAVYC